MQQLLEARFQQLADAREETAPAPPGLRKEVFRTLDLIDTLGEVGDLFTGKLVETTADFIDLIEHKDND